eukprot:TRINITY_DN10766_c0_g3_i1.p1 TRINITY_DN10766_c0_g3~~TRINITY_DN10766_c0_g3_i1.p1  ORF type:complete len:705 (-),score=111.85 TRINITY_DN10766_c0_g3_i1:96-1931(-)
MATPAGSNPVVRTLQEIEGKLKDDVFFEPVPWVHSPQAGLLFGVIILLNTFTMGLDVELEEDGRSHISMYIVESIFLGLFWVELVLRIRADGLVPFFQSRWGLFDFTCTLMGCVDTWVLSALGPDNPLAGVSMLRMLRLVRLLRLVRAFNIFSALAELVKVIGGSFSSLVTVSFLMTAVVYCSSIFVSMVLREHSQGNELLENLTRHVLFSMYHHLALVTAEGYVAWFIDATEFTSPRLFWVLYWCMLVVLLNSVLVNVMVGTITNETLGVVNEEKEELSNIAHDSTCFRNTLLLVFNSMDKDENHTIDADEFERLFQDDNLLDLLTAFHINVKLPLSYFSKLFGLDRKVEITFEEFYEGCVRLCGSAGDTRSMTLQHEIAEIKDVSDYHINQICVDLACLMKTCGLESQEGVASVAPPAGLAPDKACAHSNPYVVEDPAQRHVQMQKKKNVFCARNGEHERRMKQGTAADSATAESDTYNALLSDAYKYFGELEQQQDDLFLQLADLRYRICGEHLCVAPCCPNGHVLLPLGRSSQPTGWAEYVHWVCNGNDGAGCLACTSSGAERSGASHLTELRRYHCAACRFDLCEACYRDLLRDKIQLYSAEAANG